MLLVVPTSANAKAIDRVNGWCLALAPPALLALMWWFAGWTGEGHENAAPEAAWVLIARSWPALVWMTAALGLGLPLRMALLNGAKDPMALQVALGIAAMLFLDEALGTLGLLQIGGSIGAWLLIGVGCALATVQFLKWLRVNRRAETSGAPPLLVWSCLPALAVLLLASTSAPGWLWSTEFGGYDALSYHLELPKEWLALGGIKPLQHNVYSFLPGYMEAAYYHLMVLTGDSIGAVYACQLLHALMAVIAAWMISRIGSRLCARATGIVAGVLMLGTPWVIVTGSLAYNEMAVTLMLAAGVLAALEQQISPAGRGTLIGAFAATACAAKLTALGMATAPLGIAILFTIERRRWIVTLGCATLAAAIVLMPWWIRNAISCGNPVFPFATSVFGLAHWTAEQATIWRSGHSTDSPLNLRFIALWDQFLRFGIGENPHEGEPWKPLWLVLPWMAMIGLIVGFVRPQLRRWSIVLGLILASQIAFWLLFTHLQSRFLVPAVAPMCLLAAIAIDSLMRLSKSPAIRGVLTVFVALGMLAWCGASAAIFRNEARGAPAAAIGLADTFNGNRLTGADRRDLGMTTFPAVFVNHLLPESGQVLLVGEAAPLYFQTDRISYNTVWDRGLLSQLMREHPDNPTAWARNLHDSGYTHVLVNPIMLDRWQRSGWNDPLITSERVLEFARSKLRLVQQYPRGEMLFELPHEQ